MSVVDVDRGTVDISSQPEAVNSVTEVMSKQNEQAKASAKRVPVHLTFKDIKYSVQLKKETKHILNGISGAVESGKMMCILGPTGSGKTSLIHIIARKIASSASKQVLGAVLCNQIELSSTQFQRISGLVTQEDVFNSVLTVRETLTFAAKLKLPSQRQEYVDKVVKQLQLEHCVSTYVGDDSNPYLKGISGGEKRRLAIAMEILDPDISILILDEPTSGLDAAAALNVSNVLRSLADTGIGVAATLHQPRATIVSSFETLMVLSQGRRVFHGSLSQYVPYLEVDLQCDLPKHDNPYDFLLDVLNPLIRKQVAVSMGVLPEDCEDTSKILLDAFHQSSLCRTMDEAVDLVPGMLGREAFLLKNRYQGVGWLGKFATILHRTFLIKLRDPMVLMTQASTGVMMGVIFGVLYWQSYDKQKEFVILDTQMACTMSTLMAIWLPYDVTLTFPRERQIFLRERKAGLYSTSSFYVARILSDMPFHIFSVVLMAGLLYPMVGLQQGAHLWLGLNIVGVLVGASLMQMIGAVSRTFEEANILMMLIMMMSMIMSTGFLREVPSWLEWLREISVMGLVADLAMYFEFRDVDPQYGTPQELFAEYGVRLRTDEDAWRALGILLGIFLVARVITFLAVKFVYTGRSCGENVAD